MNNNERIEALTKKYVEDVTHVAREMAREHLLSVFDLTNEKPSAKITTKAVAKIAKATKKATKKVAAKTVAKIKKQVKVEKKDLKQRQKDAKRAHYLRSRERNNVVLKAADQAWLAKYTTAHPVLG